ncbi:Competence protein ComGC [Turicibacter sanguinis]|nr:Competence protein ComGC [Turicibacter sanguinis]
MMIVLIVVSILTLLIIPNAAKYITKANEDGCVAYKASIVAQNTANSFIGEPTVSEDPKIIQKLCTSDSLVDTNDGIE